MGSGGAGAGEKGLWESKMGPDSYGQSLRRPKASEETASQRRAEVVQVGKN